MTNKFSFNIQIRCGKETRPEVMVTYIGSANQTMRIGSEVYTKDDLAEWIEGNILTAVKKSDKR